MAVRDFKMDEDGDIAIDGGDFATVADEEAVRQGIKVRVGMFLGECYLDESVGINYIDEVFVKNPDPLVVRAIISEAIAETPDVTNVIGAQLVDDGDRNASISYSVDTVFSDVPLSDQIKVP